MESKSLKRLRIDLSVEGVEGEIHLPGHSEPIRLFRSEDGMASSISPLPHVSEQPRGGSPVAARPYQEDSFSVGARKLLCMLGVSHSHYSEASTLQLRLAENEHTSLLYGSTETRRADKAQILHSLTRLAADQLGVSFMELCLSSHHTPGDKSE